MFSSRGYILAFPVMNAEESYQATLEAAAEACRAQAALLEDRLDALRSGQTFSNTDMEGFALNSKAYHCDQTALWNSFLVSEIGLGKAKASAHALDGAHRYAVLPKDALFVLRPDPPCKNIQHPAKGDLLDRSYRVIIVMIITEGNLAEGSVTDACRWSTMLFHCMLSDMNRNGNTAADDYQDVRNHLKQSMKMNPLVGEMQVT